jgi:EAL domain-containing protein (putative c-di-GMP-specific phosphodiesterase class I)
MLATEGLPVRVGVAVYPQAGRCAGELLAHAEQALQHVRADGRSSWRAHQLADQVSPESRRAQRLELAVREGLAGQAFRLHYQPRVDAKTGRVEAVEALLRWQDPEDGLLLPAQFLPLADRAGWMPALDDWALEQALHQAARWRDAGSAVRLTVNVSGASLSRPAYARRVAALLDATRWPARALELDLTEQALQCDADAALCNLQALSRMGVRLTLDDWGSGESALAVLRRFPLNAVKIDRSVLRLVPQQRAESLLVQALTAMAAALGLEVYAEGVETEAQRAFVVEAGCSGWQGLLSAPARDRRSVERLLQADLAARAGTAPRRAASA